MNLLSALENEILGSPSKSSGSRGKPERVESREGSGVSLVSMTTIVKLDNRRICCASNVDIVWITAGSSFIYEADHVDFGFSQYILFFINQNSSLYRSILSETESLSTQMRDPRVNFEFCMIWR